MPLQSAEAECAALASIQCTEPSSLKWSRLEVCLLASRRTDIPRTRYKPEKIVAKPRLLAVYDLGGYRSWVNFCPRMKDRAGPLCAQIQMSTCSAILRASSTSIPR